MQLKYHWPLSKAVRRSVLKVGTELIFPMVTDNQRDNKENTDDPQKVEFGLWIVDVESGEERQIKAPFFIERPYARALNYKWIGWSHIGGLMVFTLMSRGSYEHNYHLFSFDGKTWKQMLKSEPTQLVVFGEQKFKTWTDAGPLELSDFPLSGGGIAVVGGPLTFAADYTHAFSYDNGPMTPTAPEYEELKKRRGGPLTPGLKFGGCHLDESPEILECLPDDHDIHSRENKWVEWVKCKEGLLLMDWRHSEGAKGITLLEL